ncbi:hypothetical protein [Nonomuraea helvata]|uniref:Uncharacterized protein n=1 Tax=Nonomuraea helvata TaxID=37484 RepID=A0ABV5S3B5_9ACTN
MNTYASNAATAADQRRVCGLVWAPKAAGAGTADDDGDAGHPGLLVLMVERLHQDR